MSYVRFLWCALAALLGMVSPSMASASDEVCVLQPTADRSAQDFAIALTGLLQREANNVPGWTLADENFTTDEIRDALGCESLDNACLAEAADSLAVEIIVIPEVTRVANRYQLTISLYRQAEGRITGSVDDDFPVVQSDIDDLRPRIAGYLSGMGARMLGSLTVQVGVADATVRLNGRVIGETNADGALEVSELPPGQYAVEVEASDYEVYSGAVTVEPGATAIHDAQLQAAEAEPSGPGFFETTDWRRVGGYSLVGVGTVFAGLTIWSWVSLGIDGLWGIQNQSDFRGAIAASAVGTDVCSLGEAEQMALTESGINYGRVQQACSDIPGYERNQFIFGGLSLAALGIGIYLLVTGDDEEIGSDEASASELRLTLEPQFSPHHASVSARLTF